MSQVVRLIKEYNKRLKVEDAKRKEGGVPYLTAGAVTNNFKKDLRSFLVGWKAGKEKKEKEEKEEKEENGGEHTSSSGKLQATLWRKGNYSNNCYKFLKGDAGRRKVFEKPTTYIKRAYSESPYDLRADASEAEDFTTVKAFLEVLESSYGFGTGKGQKDCNFNPKAKLKGQKTPKGNPKEAGNSRPYEWNAHHMIPCGAFYQELDSSAGVGGVFTDDQFALILMSKYNVNHGHNMIPLPSGSKADFFQPVHAMVTHPSSHNQYSQLVQNEMRSVSKNLDEKASKDEPHPKVPNDIKVDLEKLEDRLWKMLVKLGKMVVLGRIVGRPPNLTPDKQKVVVKGALK